MSVQDAKGDQIIVLDMSILDVLSRGETKTSMRSKDKNSCKSS